MSSRAVRPRPATALGLALAAGLAAGLVTACEPAGDPAADHAAQPADTAASADTTPPADTAGPRLTPDGWGPLRIGMTRAEVVAAAGEDAHPEAVGGPEPEACDQFRPARAPEGLLVMIERDRLTRISVADPAEVETDRGFGVGASADEVAAAYGDDAVITPHKYLDPPAGYITVWSADPSDPDARGIVYETGRDGRVTHVHVGGRSIQYVEGCL